jgi:Acetyltransferase (GNAT) domain
MQVTRSRTLELFDSSKEAAWNRFVTESSNGTFLLNRQFMDYHSDRFNDASLIVMDGSDIVGLLPASIHDRTVSSHAGLTYGGLIVGGSQASADAIHASLLAICNHLRDQGVSSLVYKPIPHMYHKVPSEADLHALFRLGAKLVRRDLSSAFAPNAKLSLRKGRKALVQRAAKISDLLISESGEWFAFHEILKARLSEKYDAEPVHSALELEMLARRFPENIRLIAATLDSVLIAACVVFESDRVVHAQYLATNELGRETGAMDLLLTQLIQVTNSKAKWFDFGISTTDNGMCLNGALAHYKEGFGAKSVVYDWYRIDF